ncbi:pilin [Patescibacteria group bacterium]|nr:pilin [Patescibacteria group bacterium]MBU1448539.1 pilin [Patescibacteria group bacterium]MBU2613625.1 pilin [Patescibacteria group bacterium]
MTHTKKKLVRFAATLGMTAAIVLPSVALAQPDSLNAGDLGVDAIQSSIKLGSGDIRQTAARIINVALGFLGIIAVVIVLLGGFKYMISGGNEEKTSEAKKLIVSGIIGLAIILSAWAITSFVISRLVTATQDV